MFFFVVVVCLFLPLGCLSTAAHQVGKDGAEPSSIICFFPWDVRTLTHMWWERVKGRAEWVGQQDPGPASSDVWRKSPLKIPVLQLFSVTALFENISLRR